MNIVEKLNSDTFLVAKPPYSATTIARESKSCDGEWKDRDENSNFSQKIIIHTNFSDGLFFILKLSMHEIFQVATLKFEELLKQIFMTKINCPTKKCLLGRN